MKEGAGEFPIRRLLAVDTGGKSESKQGSPATQRVSRASSPRGLYLQRQEKWPPGSRRTHAGCGALLHCYQHGPHPAPRVSGILSAVAAGSRPLCGGPSPQRPRRLRGPSSTGTPARRLCAHLPERPGVSKGLAPACAPRSLCPPSGQHRGDQPLPTVGSSPWSPGPTNDSAAPSQVSGTEAKVEEDRGWSSDLLLTGQAPAGWTQSSVPQDAPHLRWQPALHAHLRPRHCPLSAQTQGPRTG